jgi:hypothetical protein
MLSFLASCSANQAAVLCALAAPLISFCALILFIGAVEVAAEIFFPACSSED